jgi:hypothetical protein
MLPNGLSDWYAKDTPRRPPGGRTLSLARTRWETKPNECDDDAIERVGHYAPTVREIPNIDHEQLRGKTGAPITHSIAVPPE